MTAVDGTLDPLVRIRGVRGALLVSAEDAVVIPVEAARASGLVIAEASMAGLDGAAVAALTASVVTRCRKACLAGGLRPPRLVQLTAARGVVLAAVGTELLVVAVAATDGDLGMLRLALLRAAGRED